MLRRLSIVMFLTLLLTAAAKPAFACEGTKPAGSACQERIRLYVTPGGIRTGHSAMAESAPAFRVGGRFPRVMLSRMGNIAPYRRDLLSRIAQNWERSDKEIRLVVLIRIARDGSTVETEILRSSGDKLEDERALKAIEDAHFSPLPSWYQGQALNFKVGLSNHARRAYNPRKFQFI